MVPDLSILLVKAAMQQGQSNISFETTGTAILCAEATAAATAELPYDDGDVVMEDDAVVKAAWVSDKHWHI